MWRTQCARRRQPWHRGALPLQQPRCACCVLREATVAEAVAVAVPALLGPSAACIPAKPLVLLFLLSKQPTMLICLHCPSVSPCCSPSAACAAARHLPAARRAAAWPARGAWLPQPQAARPHCRWTRGAPLAAAAWRACALPAPAAWPPSCSRRSPSRETAGGPMFPKLRAHCS